MKSPSKSAVAAMSATSASPPGVSTMASTTTDALLSAGAGPTRRPERIGPNERIPSGG